MFLKCDENRLKIKRQFGGNGTGFLSEISQLPSWFKFQEIDAKRRLRNICFFSKMAQI